MDGAAGKDYDLTMKNMKEKLKDVITASLDLLFPPSCPSCNTMTESADRSLCTDCFSQLQFIETPYCTFCGKAFSSGVGNHLCGDCLKSSWNFDQARSIFAYEKIIASLIHRLKYSEEMTSLATFRYLGKQSPVVNDLTPPDLILPIPLHIKRLRGRGFNQSLLLAKEIFPEETEKIQYDILLRQKETPTQTGLSGKERRKNLKNAFVVKRAAELTGRNILMVDDVFTTGATVNECAKVLKKTGCNRVEVLTVCRVDKIFS